MRVYFTNLGCKLNQAELEALARRFAAAGHEAAASLEAADLHVINSCTVTHVAARASRKVARRGRRANPRLRTVLTGCYASEQPAAAARLAGVDLVVPNERKEDLLELVHRAFPETVPASPAARATAPLPIPYVPLDFGNTRALVKVEDGCNMRCSFCIIPFTRGAQRSRPLPAVVEEVAALAAGGYREVVVTGVQISSYRWDEAKLYDLVAALLEETAVPRLRLTSIAPWDFDRRLLELWREPRFAGRLCRHVHLSLQSGSSATLRRMRRPYTAGEYAALVEEIRAAVPGVAVTTDVIVGFPGETAGEFEESLRFVADMAFAKVHAFPYSPRPGTAAATMGDAVPAAERKARMEAMLAVAAEAEEAFRSRHLGQRLGVLWEGRKNGGDLWQGMTDNYLRVLTRAREDLTNTLLPTRLTALAEGGLLGAVSPP